MKVRRLFRGGMEAYNNKVRIRLQKNSGNDMARVTIYRLKVNGFYASKRSFEVQTPVSIHEVVEQFGGFVSAEGLTPTY